MISSKINQEKLLDEVLQDKEMRKAFFEHNFEAFFQFHFGWDWLKEFHYNWLKLFGGNKDLLFITLRASRKTTIARGYAVWCIAYSKEPYIIVQSFEDKMSSAWVRSVAKMLMEATIVEDYGHLFPYQMRREDMQKASFHDFESTTGVKIESRSFAQNLRGANEHEIGAHAKRPTLLFLDDIDIDTSTRNIDIIDANFDKLRTETIGAMDPTRRRIIFLGNVIRNDGIAARFEQEYKNDERWVITRMFLMDGPDGSNIWPEVFTEEIVAKLRSDGSTSFNANYLGIPMADGESIIKRSSIRYVDVEPEGCRYVGGIDPAFSEKTGSDPMAFTISGHKKVEGQKTASKYVVACFEYKDKEKDEEKFCNSVAEWYRKKKLSRIKIESNNGGEIIARMLKRRGLAVDLLHSSKDKVTRLREHEGSFERGEVFFLPGTEKLVTQLLEFPNVKHDDMVDSMVNSFVETASMFIA